MTSPSITRTTLEGFDAVRVHTGPLSLSLVPELGGKVSSLRDEGTGREWLWRHPRMAYRRVPHGSSYVAEADTGGWDECFPSVAACAYPSAPWAGAAIQDHGELWSQTAALDIVEGTESVALRTRWRGIALPYALTRTITLTANSARLRVEYAAENSAEAPLNFVWCIHPLLAIEPGMELRLPPGARFNVGGQFPAALLSRDHNIAYPFSAPSLNFPTLPEPSAGAALKLWSDPLPPGAGWATLRARDGELRLTWDTALLPQVAAWMNFGAWAGDGGAPYFNLGLEPCIGAQDSLAEAVTQRHLFATLPPRGAKAWWLEIELAP